MSEWQLARQAALERLLDGFTQAGFAVRSSNRIEGELAVPGKVGTVPLDIQIPDSYPYAPPSVKAIDGTGGLSWHTNADGTLCLWASADSGDLPWLEVNAVLDRVREWVQNESAGWPDDPPDLDMERYWHRSAELLIHGDLQPLVGNYARVERKNGVWRLKSGPAPKNSRQRSAAVIDIGHAEVPLRSFDDVLERSGSMADRLAKDIERGRLQMIVVRYWRKDNAGVLGLKVARRMPTELVAIDAVADADEARSLRSGTDQLQLSNTKVAIVGLGAIGSQVADLLARSGVGVLTFVDFDLVKPGNLVRHIAARRHIGKFKTEAVRELLAAQSPPTRIQLLNERLTNVDQVETLLGDHDLVVDASADQLTTRLLMDAAEAIGASVVSVCLVRDGQVARVDRVPLAVGEQHASQTAALTSGEIHYESGCGDPVSPAPMWAASAAASRCVGMVVDILTHRNQYPPTIVDVLVAGDDSCVRVGTSQ